VKVVIIGAGIAGLTVAYQLNQHNIDVTIVEARSRIGGRILTVFDPKRPSVPLDFGSTWFLDEHKHLKRLIRDLRLKRYSLATKGLAIYDQGVGKTPRQFTSQDTSPKYSLIGGMHTLTNKLQKRLPKDTVHLDTVVTEISSDKDGVVVSATQHDKIVFYDADYVISTIPPRVASTSLTFHPSLDRDVHLALQAMPTWMGQIIKIFLVYDSPFWRKMGLSGESKSDYGIVNEFYDVSPHNSTFGVLGGVINPDSRGYNMFREERKKAIIEQVKRVYGWQANEIKVYDEINWAYESYTSHHSTPPYAIDYGNPLLQAPVMNGRVFWGSSEVATVSSGYMEGAVYRSNEIAEAILKTVKTT
jgi:monoamine oxidase